MEPPVGPEEPNAADETNDVAVNCQQQYDSYCTALERVLCHLENSINSTQEALIQLRTILNKQDGDNMTVHRSWIIVEFFEDILNNYKEELDAKRYIVSRLHDCHNDIDALRALHSTWEFQRCIITPNSL